MTALEYTYDALTGRRAQRAARGGAGRAGADFAYDGGGGCFRKVWVTNNGKLRRERIYLGGYEVWRSYSKVGNNWVLKEERETLHVADDARRVCMVETLTLTGGSAPNPITSRLRFQLDNHLGTCCVEVDHLGAVISYEEYHPYGTSAYRAFAGEVSAKRYRYTGKERDEETSLYYHGARYYAPWLGRWTQADPAGTVDGTNLYAYVRGSPIVMSDPGGMQGTAQTGFSRSVDLSEVLANVEEQVHGFTEAPPAGEGGEVNLSTKAIEQVSPEAARAITQLAEEPDISQLQLPPELQEKVTPYSRPEPVNDPSRLPPLGKVATNALVQVLTGPISLLSAASGPGGARGPTRVFAYEPHQEELGAAAEADIGMAIEFALFAVAGLAAGARSTSALGAGAASEAGASARVATTLEQGYLRQGFTEAQAAYLAEPYEGMGHHFIPRRTPGVPHLYSESPLNVLKPRVSRGEFYELHYKVDPRFYGTALPKHAGGGAWSGRALGLKKYGAAGRLWHGSPQPLKTTLGVTATGAGAAAWLLTRED